MTAISPSILTSPPRQSKKTLLPPSSRWRGDTERRAKKNKQNAPGSEALQLAAVRCTSRARRVKSRAPWDHSREPRGRSWWGAPRKDFFVLFAHLGFRLPRFCVVRPVCCSAICFTWRGRRESRNNDEGKCAAYFLSLEQRSGRRELANLRANARRAAPCIS